MSDSDLVMSGFDFAISNLEKGMLKPDFARSERDKGISDLDVAISGLDRRF